MFQVLFTALSLVCFGNSQTKWTNPTTDIRYTKDNIVIDTDADEVILLVVHFENGRKAMLYLSSRQNILSWYNKAIGRTEYALAFDINILNEGKKYKSKIARVEIGWQNAKGQYNFVQADALTRQLNNIIQAKETWIIPKRRRNRKFQNHFNM